MTDEEQAYAQVGHDPVSRHAMPTLRGALMGWPKGKPRLTEEQRVERDARRERPSYPVWWEHVGCGYCPYQINGPFVAGRDDAAFNDARVRTQEHVKVTHVSGEVRRTKTKADAVLAAAVDVEQTRTDARLRKRIARGSV